MKKIILLITALLFLTTGCKKEEIEKPIVTMTIKDYGDVIIELYPEIAYNTVANFVNLIEDGFYDENTIHRLAKGFVLQGGDPTATGSGGPGYNIKGEFALNGVNNGLSHSAGSQFFIVLDDSAKKSLDGKYAAFGKVTEGMEVIKEIENAGLEITDEAAGTLKEPLTIEKVIVDTKGHTYKAEKITA